LWTKTTRGYSPNAFGVIEGLDKNYSHYFVRFNRHGELIEMSKGFRFISPGIEFVGGMVEKDDTFVISFGKKDVSSHLAVVPREIVVKSMKPLV
jgi:hypothetical protein